MPAPSPDTWSSSTDLPPASAATPAPARRAPPRPVREPAPVPADGALRVAPLALAALVASAVILAAVLLATGFAMGRATRVGPLRVECWCAP